MQHLTIQEVEYVAFQLAKQLMEFNEPIPDFTTRFPHILESCLITPFQRFDGKSLYPSMVSKAAMLFYLMIKNHPFQNGNKRVAITTMLVFLRKNERWLAVDTQEFYNFTVWVAASPPAFKDEVVKAAEKFIRTHITT